MGDAADLLAMLEAMIDELHRERLRVSRWRELWDMTAKRDALGEVAYRLRTGGKHTRWAFSDGSEDNAELAALPIAVAATGTR